MDGMWKAVSNATTPVTLLAVLLGVAAVVYAVHMRRRYGAVEKAEGDETRLRMLRDLLGQAMPDVDSLTRDQKNELVRQYARDGMTKFKWVAIIVGGLVALLIVAAVVIALATKAEPAKQTSGGAPTPLARIDNFGGSPLVHRGGNRFRSDTIFGLFDAHGREVGHAYPVLSFDLGKSRPGTSVRLDRTRVVWTPVDFERRLLSSMHSDNFKPPLTFLARLAPKPGGQTATSHADIKIAEGVVDGSIDFTDALPTRKCRIEFEGTPGLYRIERVELDFADVPTEEKVTLASRDTAFVYIPEPSASAE